MYVAGVVLATYREAFAHTLPKKASKIRDRQRRTSSQYPHTNDGLEPPHMRQDKHKTILTRFQ